MKARRSTIVVTLACALALAGGCAQRRAQQQAAYAAQEREARQAGTYGATGGDTPSAARRAAPSEAALTDAEVAKILETVNRGEVAQAELAIAKADDPEVRDYAERMRDEHRRALERGQQVARTMDTPPRPSELDQQLFEEGQRTMATLEGVEGAAFDRQYLDAQVATHRKVLELIDGVLLPSVQSEQLRAEIEAVRPIIASHLDHAERIEAPGG